jgi:hypothetical protein
VKLICALILDRPSFCCSFFSFLFLVLRVIPVPAPSNLSSLALRTSGRGPSCFAPVFAPNVSRFSKPRVVSTYLHLHPSVKLWERMPDEVDVG